MGGMRDLQVQKWFTVVQRRQCAFLRILSNFTRDGSIVSHQIEQGIVRPSLHKALEGHTISRRCAAAGCTHVQNLPGKPARGCFCSRLFALFTYKFLRGAPPRTPLDLWLPPEPPIGYPILDERPRQVLHLVPTPRSALGKLLSFDLGDVSSLLATKRAR